MSSLSEEANVESDHVTITCCSTATNQLVSYIADLPARSVSHVFLFTQQNHNNE